MTWEEIERYLRLTRQQNAWLRWKVENQRQAKRNRQLPEGVLKPFAGPESLLEDEVETKGDRPDFAVPELDVVLAGTEREVDELMRLYRL